MGLRALLAAGMLALSVVPGNAAALFVIEEVGSDVVGTLSGDLNVAGLPSYTSPSYFARINGGGGYLITSDGSTFSPRADVYAVTGPSSFGTISSDVFGTSNGGVFELWPNRVLVPLGYTGGALSGGLTLTGQTIASLGLTAGEYVYTLLNDLEQPVDTVTLRIVEPSSVPLPAAFPLLAGSLGFAGFMGWRRKKSATGFKSRD